MKKYNKENCQCLLRKVSIDKLGRIIILSGQHAFQWSIIVKSECTLTITTYENRTIATKEFNRLTKKR